MQRQAKSFDSWSVTLFFFTYRPRIVHIYKILLLITTIAKINHSLREENNFCMVTLGKQTNENIEIKAYALEWCVCAVFGNIKFNHGFKRFRLKSTEKVTVEWGLVAIAHNLRKYIERKMGNNNYKKLTIDAFERYMESNMAA